MSKWNIEHLELRQFYLPIVGFRCFDVRSGVCLLRLYATSKKFSFSSFHLQPYRYGSQLRFQTFECEVEFHPAIELFSFRA